MAGRLDEAERVEPRSRAEWRRWLAANHATSPGVWLVDHKKASGRARLDYEEIVCEALCFGWIDSTLRAEGDRRLLYLAPRRPGGTWARSNKERVVRLIAEGLMRPAGQAAIDAAKADGSWSALDSVEALEVPDDLAAALADAGLRDSYEAAGVGLKKQILWSLVSAKRPATRARRLAAALGQLRVRADERRGSSER